MTSGQFHSLPIPSISVAREERHRRSLPDIASLAESIARLGLIHPIVVTRDGALVAGERRLTACDQLGWTHIPVQFVDECPPEELKAIELEENIKRSNLTWQEECKAVADLHEARKRLDPTWTAAKTAEAIGVVPGLVSDKISVAENLHDPAIANNENFSTAKNLVARRKERQRQTAIEDLNTLDDQPQSILTADFREWAATYAGPKFNLIHCDFPYGIGAHAFKNMGAETFRPGAEGYEDSAETYWSLVQTLLANIDRIATESCHLMFWFSMHHYQETLAHLRTAFDVQPFPLIWVKSDSTGIIPDPARGPRRVYETAFLASRGDRKIVRSVANAFLWPTTVVGHVSEKPEVMLSHFMRMLVDGSTWMLDPTCGSGSALRAALGLGAEQVFGMDINEEFVRTARVRLTGARDDLGSKS